MKTEVKIKSLLLGFSLLTAGFASAQTTQTTAQVQTNAQTQRATNPDIEALKLKISSNPDDTQSLVALATAYQNANDWNSAIATWNKITAILPDWAPAYYSIGYANQSAKNNAGAKAAYEQYITKVKPEEVEWMLQNKI
ncbi:tetratricopeptide repeat protein [Epilithonimonas sp.]|uniref:tetratricopeptide repeat protein n=1 Tax=Epilithonimonas sp. TaxID=2894511 RepID=UPI00289EDC1B|nr:tetratricopeptide repeat protein [Epilithonimonas sp.]